MLVLRILALLAVSAVGVLALSWALTGDRKYLRLAWRVFQFALALALGFLLLMAVERIAFMA